MAPKSRSDVDAALLKAINDGSLEQVTQQLACGANVNCPDENGMTPLMHACFKGRTDLVKLLLERRADVNADEHDQGYSALMFGALSGKTDVVRLLLAAGAKTQRHNKVNRTASQMAAFVGQHQVVSLINNHLDVEELLYFSVARGLNVEPKLAPALVAPLHALLSDSNLNAARVTRNALDAALLPAHASVRRVLEDVAERQWKQRAVNEVLSLKAFYFSVLVGAAGQAYDQEVAAGAGVDGEPIKLTSYLRGLMKSVGRDAVPLGSEQLVRRALREYPYSESNLMQSMVRTLAPVKVGQHPTSLSVLSSGINGQQFFKDQPLCEACHEPGATPDKPAGRELKRCVACHAAPYCDAVCQRLHWFVHKKRCAQMKADAEAEAAAKAVTAAADQEKTAAASREAAVEAADEVKDTASIVDAAAISLKEE